MKPIIAIWAASCTTTSAAFSMVSSCLVAVAAAWRGGLSWKTLKTQCSAAAPYCL